MDHPFVHPTAVVDQGAVLGPSVKVWHFCHVRSGAVLGRGVSLGKGVYVDAGVRIGEGSRVQNGVSIYTGVEVSDWCFIGPHVIFTNDVNPRAGNRKWTPVKTKLELGMSIGAGSVIRCGITVGSFAMVGAGAIVTKDVPPFRLATGFPARAANKVCACGESLFPLRTPYRTLLGPCCRRRMNPDLCRVAEELLARLAKQNT